MPNDTNPLGNLMGGQLMLWMDIISAIAAQKFSGHRVVTASVDNVSFKHAIKLGDVVTLTAQVTRSYSSSMEVYIKVIAENLITKTQIESNTAFYTFVAVDQHGKPIAVPEAIAETESEITLYNGSMQRRQMRLILAGRLKPKDATELLSLFSHLNSHE